jgi:hypothetical protein
LKEYEKSKEIEIFKNVDTQIYFFLVFIDGANVAMYNQNFETSKFSFYQIEKVIDSIEKNFGGKRVLVIIHEGRLKPHLINREDLQVFLYYSFFLS